MAEPSVTALHRPETLAHCARACDFPAPVRDWTWKGVGRLGTRLSRWAKADFDVLAVLSASLHAAPALPLEASLTRLAQVARVRQLIARNRLPLTPPEPHAWRRVWVRAGAFSRTVTWDELERACLDCPEGASERLFLERLNTILERPS